MMILRTESDIQMLFDEIGNQYISPYRESIHRAGENWLLEKQSEFQGDEYFEKIETNAVYLTECAAGADQVLARFLHDGKPDIQNDMEFSKYWVAVKVYFGRLNIDAYLSFLRHGIWPKPVSPDALFEDSMEIATYIHGLDIESITKKIDKNRYTGLRKLRLAGDMPRYIDELEFICKYMQGELVTCSYYLKIFSNSQGIACSAKSMKINTVLDAVQKSIKNRTALFLD
jgi:hypothetical protein